MTLFVLAVSTLAPAHARSTFNLGVGHEWAVPVSAEGAALGPGLQGSVGYGIGLKVARLIPEIGVSGYYEQGVLVPRVGGRFLIGWILTPGVYAHAAAAIGGPFAEPAIGFDGGASLELAVPFVRVGAYGGMQVFGGPSGPGIPDQTFVGGLQIVLSIPLGKDDELMPPAG
jgi:hypothetical protein